MSEQEDSRFDQLVSFVKQGVPGSVLSLSAIAIFWLLSSLGVVGLPEIDLTPPVLGTQVAQATTPAPPTETPEPTPTPAPTNTPAAPTATQGAQATPFDGAPLCANHDPSEWHGLWNAAQGCHYDHEHKHDPAEVEDIFGEAGCWFDACGQSISYPWETFGGVNGQYAQWDGNTANLENVAKHANYGWIVRRDIEPYGASGAYVAAFRWQYHAKGTAQGVNARFHSFSLEVQICLTSQPDVCGIVRTGGHMDFGNLEVNGNVIPNSFEADAISDLARRRIHFEHPAPPPNRCLNQFKNDWFWYGRHRAGFAGAASPFGTGINAAIAQGDAPNNVLINASQVDTPLCPVVGNVVQGVKNGTTVAAHVLHFSDPDGLFDFVGYTDRYGLTNAACAAIGLDCIPTVIDLPDELQGALPSQYRDDQRGYSGSTGVGDVFDLSPAALGTGSEWWVIYEN